MKTGRSEKLDRAGLDRNGPAGPVPSLYHIPANNLVLIQIDVVLDVNPYLLLKFISSKTTQDEKKTPSCGYIYGPSI